MTTTCTQGSLADCCVGTLSSQIYEVRGARPLHAPLSRRAHASRSNPRAFSQALCERFSWDADATELASPRNGGLRGAWMRGTRCCGVLVSPTPQTQTKKKKSMFPKFGKSKKKADAADAGAFQPPLPPLLL